MSSSRPISITCTTISSSPYTDCNYGGVFSLWDRMFGTFAELTEDETIFGLDTHMEPATTQDFGTLITLPFRAASETGNALGGDYAALAPKAS